MYKYKAKGRLLFRSLRVPSSSLPGAVFLQVVLCFPFQYSKFLNKPHTRTHTYSVQLQNQERHSVQEPQSTKQLSPGAVSLQVVLCFPFQYSKFLSKPHTRTHTHTHTHTYSVQLQNQERHSVQEPQSTKQLSPGAVSLQVVLCFAFQYSKFLSKPPTRAHTHLQCTTTKPRAPLCSETSEY